MIKQLQKYLLCMSILLLTACSSTLEQIKPNEEIIPLQANNVSAILGTYSNVATEAHNMDQKPSVYSVTHYPSTSLWAILVHSDKHYDNWDKLHIRFRQDTNKKLIADLVNNRQVLESVILNGYFKNGFLYLDSLTSLDSFYIIPFIENNSLKIGVTQDKKLVMIKQIKSLLFFTIIPVAKTENTFKTIYLRVDNLEEEDDWD